jgi:hypothetical protein
MSMNPQELENILRLANKNISEGVFYEPRMYFDIVNFTGQNQREFGNPSIFRNGEKYPVRITHLCFAMREQDNVNQQDPVAGDERMVARYGLRIRQHDSYYMNVDFAPLAIWQNCHTAPVQSISQGQSTWKFDKPFILSSRDTMAVEGILEPLTQLTPGPRRVTVAFTGYGLLSKRPYFRSGFRNLDVGQPSQGFPADNYRNDGAEPIAITEMTVFCANPDQYQNPAGDIRAVRLRVRQVGNGTNQWWVNGPVPPVTANPWAPGTVWGPTTGRAVVHKLPREMSWEPNEGFSIELANLAYDPLVPRQDQVVISALGYIVVT